MAPAIETDDLTKDFPVGFWRPRPYRALDGLSLQVDAGEVFGFLGPNGSGKSTTLKLLMQLIYPTRGAARILGQPVGDVAVRRRIGFLAENPYYYDYLTAEELLVYFARVFGYRGADASARAARVLDDVGIGHAERLAETGVAAGGHVAVEPDHARVTPVARQARFERHEAGTSSSPARAREAAL